MHVVAFSCSDIHIAAFLCGNMHVTAYFTALCKLNCICLLGIQLEYSGKYPYFNCMPIDNNKEVMLLINMLIINRN